METIENLGDTRYVLGARQAVAVLKVTRGTGDRCPNFPEGVSGSPPLEPNAYSDGGVTCPSSEHYRISGMGVFWPDRSKHNHRPNELEVMQVQEVWAKTARKRLHQIARSEGLPFSSDDERFNQVEGDEEKTSKQLREDPRPWLHEG